MLDVLNVGQRLDGDLNYSNSAGHYFQTITGTYVGGQPVGLGPSGLIFGTALAAAPRSFFGILRNNSLIDTRVGGGEVVTTTDLTKAKPTICYPGNKAKVYKGSVQGDGSVPYEDVVWAIGNDVFISTGGLWTNVSAGGATQSWGKVQTVPSTYGDPLVFEFTMYNQNTYAV